MPQARPFPLLLVLLLAAPAVADTIEALRAEGNEDPQAWYAAATDAREAGDFGAAREALDRAAALGLPPVRTGFERARILVREGNREAAVAQLEEFADQGFTAVGAVANDPVLGTLEGMPAFDAFVEALSAKAYPCENDEKFREFDFWIGEWEVRTADGQLAGHNSIRRAERGCVLIEEWTGVGGTSGMSVNYLDDATGEWVQVWNSAGGTQIRIRGGMTEDGMLLTGQIHYVGSDETAQFRGLWTPLTDGRVRQFFEQSDDGGETWTPWFEGFYSRSEDAD